MIVPRFWAEGRLQHRDRKKGQITVRRLGWSDVSPQDAQANADRRTREALDRRLAGEKLLWREPKVPYNGAAGVPIREEIISTHGETIITRNSYGARCLNTPGVFFVDMDFQTMPPVGEWLTVGGLTLAFVAVVAWAIHAKQVPVLLVAGLFVFFLAKVLAVWGALVVRAWRNGDEQTIRRRLGNFAVRNSGWNVRVYRTPAGLRVLVTHRVFHPDEPEAVRCFRTFGADKLYVQMCRRQQCFRARVSAKPWRIGINDHLKPSPGTWPVAPERLPARAAWVERYENTACAFAACEFVEVLGNGAEHPAITPVRELHDTLCGANSGRPIA